MTYLIFMNYIMLVSICGHMGIITSDNVWLGFDILGVIALLIHITLKSRNKRGSVEE